MRFRIETPLGAMTASASEEGLQELAFGEGESLGCLSVLELLQEELELYFLGKLKVFQTPIVYQGTPFQRDVWEELKKIPFGSTCSYGEIAKRLGKERAYRAVAGANHANPIAIIIPCHRVIYADGGLGGYAGGIEQKQKLLAHECFCT